MLTIGRKLALFRSLTGCLHKHVARAIDVTETQLSRVENCHSSPRMSTFVALADYFGIPLEALRDDRDYRAADIERWLIEICNRAANGDERARALVIPTARWWGLLMRIEATEDLVDFERSG